MLKNDGALKKRKYLEGTSQTVVHFEQQKNNASKVLIVHSNE